MKCNERIVNLNQNFNFRQKTKIINSWLDSLILSPQWSRHAVDTIFDENGVDLGLDENEKNGSRHQSFLGCDWVTLERGCF